jgi:2-polyprenyl-6-methoxyphenol hydroxylase-like FAD-dependent oxidoreductase
MVSTCSKRAINTNEVDYRNIVVLGRLSETTYRLIVALRTEQQQAPIQDEPALTIDDFQHAVDICVGPQLRVSDPTWITRFRINQRKARQYRVGRGFLAGDASHIHSPVAGQGMNTGIQDAANLAWKLSAVAHGAPEALLDSYNEERSAVGDALVATTSRGLAAGLSTTPILEALRDHVIGPLTRLPFIQRQMLGFISETAGIIATARSSTTAAVARRCAPAIARRT